MTFRYSYLWQGIFPKSWKTAKSMLDIEGTDSKFEGDGVSWAGEPIQ